MTERIPQAGETPEGNKLQQQGQMPSEATLEQGDTLERVKGILDDNQGGVKDKGYIIRDWASI